MRITEILLPIKNIDLDLLDNIGKKADLIQKRMDAYVDKILDPNTSHAGKEFLKSKLKDEYHELKNLSPKIHQIAEAIHKLPLSDNDFKLLKELMNKPIPAIIAPIYISEIIDDDQLNDEIRILGETAPGRDIRELISDWVTRVMPEQLYRFTNGTHPNKKGTYSPIHGVDTHMYKGTNDPITGNAHGRY